MSAIVILHSEFCILNSSRVNRFSVFSTHSISTFLRHGGMNFCQQQPSANHANIYSCRFAGFIVHRSLHSPIASMRIGLKTTALFDVSQLSRSCLPCFIGQKAQTNPKNCATRLYPEQMISKTNWMSVDSVRMSTQPNRTRLDSERISVDPERILSEIIYFSTENMFSRTKRDFSTPRCSCFTSDCDKTTVV